MAKIGIIVSAGTQSRFKRQLPKALIDIKGEPLLNLNIKNLMLVCDKVYIICSHQNKQYFTGYSNVIEISSGFGCGDAVLKALTKIPHQKNDTCFIQWGDSLQNPILYKECINNYKGDVIIPCNKEQHPYVQIIKNNKNLQVLFSKYNENTSEGFHDLSVFYGNIDIFKKYLLEFQNKILVNGKYHHKHGNEMQFLDIFNETNIKAQIINMRGIQSYSFNTLKELENIKNILRETDV